MLKSHTAFPGARQAFRSDHSKWRKPKPNQRDGSSMKSSITTRFKCFPTFLLIENLLFDLLGKNWKFLLSHFTVTATALISVIHVLSKNNHAIIVMCRISSSDSIIVISLLLRYWIFNLFCCFDVLWSLIALIVWFQSQLIVGNFPSKKYLYWLLISLRSLIHVWASSILHPNCCIIIVVYASIFFYWSFMY